MTNENKNVAISSEQPATSNQQPGNLQFVSCPLCGSERAELYCAAPDRFNPDSSPLYSLRRCLHCGLIYLNPRPREEDSGQFYEHADYLPFASLTQNRSLTARLYELLRRINLRWKRRVITEFWRRTRGKGQRASSKGQEGDGNLQFATCHLLDVGCGTGEFLAAMKAEGWEVEGLERDERAAAWAREHCHLQVASGSVEQLATLDQQFDVITMWHVLEHLYSPGRALEILADHLRQDGWLLIAVPNISGIDARVYGANWVALDAPRHLNHFSLETLARLGSKHGLTLRWWRQLPLDAFFNTLMSERLAAKRRPRQWLRPYGFLWPLRLLRAVVVACVSLIGGCHTPFSYAAYGASLVCFFEKKR